jgi:uncharacterized integral membrane protein
MPISEARASLIRVVFFGGVTVLLYVLLFAFQDQLMALTRQGRWTFAVPVLVAFVFSYFHGRFTGGFWDVLGITARRK